MKPVLVTLASGRSRGRLSRSDRIMEANAHMSTSEKPSEKPATLRALVVDDEKNIRSTLTVCLEGIGCDVVAVGSSQGALAALERKHFDFAFLDLRLDKESGLDLIPELLALSPNLDIVVITAYATFATAVEAIRRGARDYVPKPLSPAQVRHMVDQAAERRALTWRVTDLENRLADEAPEV